MAKVSAWTDRLVASLTQRGGKAVGTMLISRRISRSRLGLSSPSGKRWRRRCIGRRGRVPASGLAARDCRESDSPSQAMRRQPRATASFSRRNRKQGSRSAGRRQIPRNRRRRARHDRYDHGIEILVGGRTHSRKDEARIGNCRETVATCLRSCASDMAALRDLPLPHRHRQTSRNMSSAQARHRVTTTGRAGGCAVRLRAD